MLAGRVDGVSPDEHISKATLDAIRLLAQDRPTVYLPTHDPRSGARLASRSTVADVQGQLQSSSAISDTSAAFEV